MTGCRDIMLQGMAIAVAGPGGVGGVVVVVMDVSLGRGSESWGSNT